MGRTIATGVYPKILGDAGVGPALRSAARNGASPVVVDDLWQHRHDDGIELAVYYSCLEALQNAAKHAGPDATATVRLTEDDGCAAFAVEDDGCGSDARSIRRGAGLDNIADRVSAVGGSRRIESAPGQGTHVAGRPPG